MKKFWVKLLCFLVPVKKYRKRLKNLLMDKLGGEAASALHPRAKGNVLVSYMKDSLLLKDNDIRLKYHTNRWENREIARIFYERLRCCILPGVMAVITMPGSGKGWPIWNGGGELSCCPSV